MINLIPDGDGTQDRRWLVELNPTTPDPSVEIDGGGPSTTSTLVLDGGSL